MRALQRSNEELSSPGQRALFLAARKKGLDVTKAEVNNFGQ